MFDMIALDQVPVCGDCDPRLLTSLTAISVHLLQICPTLAETTRLSFFKYPGKGDDQGNMTNAED